MSILARGSLFSLLLIPALASAQTSPDWASPQRLVRLDSVEASGVTAFENARRAWVAEGRAGNARADEGLTMAWSESQGGRTRYLMLSPFSRYADLDGIRDLHSGSDGAGGDAYLDAPHHMAIWQRIDALTMVSAADPTLAELTAGAARIEIITETDPRLRADLIATWKTIAAALREQKYPLASVVYENRFVSGQLIRIWFAKDLRTLKGAPTLKTSITWSAGDRQARDLTVRVNQLTNIEQYYNVERRPDLSRVGP